MDVDLIIFPDYNGEHYSSFSQTLSKLYPKKTILAVLNGPEIDPDKPLTKISEKVLTVFSETGYNNAFIKALTIASEGNYTNIIKLDTREHDPAYVHTISSLLTTNSLVVADLTFNEETLPIHSHDYILNKITMPNLTSKYSKLRLKLSGAHGFFGVTNTVLKQSLPKIAKLHSVTKDYTSRGIHTALIVEIVNQNNSYKIITQPATNLHDRPSSKIAEQLSDTQTLLSKLK